MSNIPRAVNEAGMMFQGIIEVINNEITVLQFAPADYREAAAAQMQKLEDNLRAVVNDLQNTRSILLGFHEPVPTIGKGEDFPDLEGSVLADIANIDKKGYRPQPTPTMDSSWDA